MNCKPYQLNTIHNSLHIYMIDFILVTQTVEWCDESKEDISYDSSWWAHQNDIYTND